MTTVMFSTSKYPTNTGEVTKFNARTVVVWPNLKVAKSIKRHIRKHNVRPVDFSWWPK